MFRGSLDRLSGLLDQLHWLFIHTQYRVRPIIRFCVCFQHFFHIGHKFGISFRRNHPIFNLSIRHPVFFSVRRTVS